MAHSPAYAQHPPWTTRLASSASGLSSSLLTGHGSSHGLTDDVAALHGARKSGVVTGRGFKHGREAPRVLSTRHRALCMRTREVKSFDRNVVQDYERELQAFVNQRLGVGADVCSGGGDMREFPLMTKSDGTGDPKVEWENKWDLSEKELRAAEESLVQPPRSILDMEALDVDMVGDLEEVWSREASGSALKMTAKSGIEGKEEAKRKQKIHSRQAAHRLEILSRHMLRSSIRPVAARHTERFHVPEGVRPDAEIPLEHQIIRASHANLDRDVEVVRRPPPVEEKDAPREEDAPAFHCPWVDCHRRLKHGAQYLRTDDGCEGLQCVHANCTEAFTSEPEWRNHILGAHHDLLETVQITYPDEAL